MTEDEVSREEQILERVASHSRAVRLIVEEATLWVDTEGEQGRRHNEELRAWHERVSERDDLVEMVVGP